MIPIALLIQLGAPLVINLASKLIDKATSTAESIKNPEHKKIVMDKIQLNKQKGAKK